jgi:hypothetical protein
MQQFDFQTKDGQHLLRLYITGDTLVFDDIKEIPRALSTINVYSCNARDETVRLCVFTALLK